MNFDEAISLIGNGDSERGRKLLFSLAERVRHARGKHPWGQETPFYSFRTAMSALNGEINELRYAYDAETADHQDYEALDVLAVAVRIANREFE